MSSDERKISRGEAENVLLRARNGDVIRFDDSGLILNLSDVVVEDLRSRLSAPPTALTRGQTGSLDAECLGDIDAWNLRREGDWFLFDANLPGGGAPRGYRRLVHGGDIIAETPGPVLGVLSLGGARRARSVPGTGKFPYHVVAPADDIGATGLSGVEAAASSNSAERLREQTQDSLLAAEILALRQQAGRGLPLMIARCESDDAASLRQLGAGPAFRNLVQAAANLQAIGQSLGKRTRLAALSLDFTLEDVLTPAGDYVQDLLCLLQDLFQALWSHDLPPVPVLMVFETSVATLRAPHWELALHQSDMNLLFSMPSYALEYDGTARLTPGAMQRRAATEAAALSEVEAGRGWQCPLFLLAEYEGQTRIRLRSNAAVPLVIDTTDPYGAGPAHGLHLIGPHGPVDITDVRVDPDEPRDLLVEAGSTLPTSGVHLSYAWDGPGALRDEWAHPSKAKLRRWALPCNLEVFG